MSENKEEAKVAASDARLEEATAEPDKSKSIDESSKDSDKESDKEDESEEEGMGLLDRPVEVTGCRARKKVERLEVSFSVPKEKTQEIAEGKGQKLGDCPRIEFHIQKTTMQELKPLHKFLFGRAGAVHLIKKNIRKFSGFPFDKESTEFDRKKAACDKFKTSALKQMCEILDIERGGTKDDLVKRILEFLLCPKDSGKKVPVKKPSGKGRKKSSEKNAKNSKGSKSKKENTEEEDSTDGVVSEEEASDEEDETHDKKKSKNSKTAKTPKVAPKKAEKKAVKKNAKASQVKGSKRKRDENLSDSDDSSDDEPIAKKSRMPSDEEIKKLVKRILDAADLQEITMKKVIKQVADAYPDCDLSHKKAFIKTTIKSVIS